MEDTLTIATAEGVRIYAITTKNLVQEAADRHLTPLPQKIWCRKLLTAIIQAIWQRPRSAEP